MHVGWRPSVWFHSPHCNYVSACLPLWHSNDSVHGCNGEGASVKITRFYSGVMRRMQLVDVAFGLIIACNGAEITSTGCKSFQAICCSRRSLKLPHCVIFFFFLSGQSRSHSWNSISTAQFNQDHMLNILFRTLFGENVWNFSLLNGSCVLQPVATSTATCVNLCKLESKSSVVWHLLSVNATCMF